MNKLFTIIALLAALGSQAQDTLKVMSYNLLNYPTARTIQEKNGYLTTIFGYAQPDILGVVELGNNVSYAESILNVVLNQNGTINKYARAAYSCTAGSSICNMLYYNAEKLGLAHQYVIPFPTLREMNHYVLYYKSPDLALTHDTIFFNVIAVHLKASDSSADAAKRNEMTTLIMQHLNTNPYGSGNVVVLGDFNMYRSTEAGYQTLTNYTANPSISFFDPLHFLPSTWTNNATIAPYCTQATRLVDIFDGGSTGGMDDRFDMILFSPSLVNNTQSVDFIEGTYTAVGQDGLHFNNSLLASPTNTTVPSNVLDALYYNSDHLPVTAKVAVQYERVLYTDLDTLGATALCQGDTTYLSIVPQAGYTYQWFRNDTLLAGATQHELAIGQAGAYRVEVYYFAQSASSATVIITEKQPPIPVISGTNPVCIWDTYLYSTPHTEGHTYTWTVTNGTIVSGQGTNEIVVQWDEAESGTVSVEESSN
jgi:hypothetical protein